VLRVVPRRHMVVADSRQFPWIAEEFAAVMESSTERLIRYFAHLNTMGALIAATRC
jgi:TetR/AcrR family transcriptional regulator of autoinduction and epiphytic fitness